MKLNLRFKHKNTHKNKKIWNWCYHYGFVKSWLWKLRSKSGVGYPIITRLLLKVDSKVDFKSGKSDLDSPPPQRSGPGSKPYLSSIMKEIWCLRIANWIKTWKLKAGFIAGFYELSYLILIDSGLNVFSVPTKPKFPELMLEYVNEDAREWITNLVDVI